MSCGTDAARAAPCSPPEALELRLERELHPGGSGVGKNSTRFAVPHLVGLEEAHEDREEYRGWSRLGTLPEVVDHIVEGFLE